MLIFVAVIPVVAAFTFTLAITFAAFGLAAATAPAVLCTVGPV
jgi:hypothetical protein